MRILTGGLLLNLFIAALTGKEVAAHLKQNNTELDLEIEPTRYLRGTTPQLINQQRIVAAPKGYDILSCIGDLSNRGHKILWEGPLRTYHMLNITTNEEVLLNETLNVITGEVNGIITANTMITAKQSVNTPSVNAQYLSGIARCQQTITNSISKYLVFIMDGYLDNNNTVLSGMPIRQQFNIADATPGVLTHGCKVAETLLGGNDNFIQGSGIEAIGLTVFNDNGVGFIAYLIIAASQIQEMIPQLISDGYILGGTFSGDGSPNSLLDTTFRELSLLLPLTVAAGNEHSSCASVSPPNAGGNIIPVGGTDQDENGATIPDYNSVFGCGKNMVYAPYCATTHLFNPGAPAVFNGVGSFCGTSEATPNFHRTFAYYSVACPTCTIEQRISLAHDATVSIDSSVGPISVLPINNVCPLDNTELFSSYKTINGKYSPEYNGTTKDGRFCVTFRVNKGDKNGNSELLIDLDDAVLKMPAKNAKVTTPMKQFAFANFVVTADNPRTGKNNINVFVQTPTGMQSILHSFAAHKVKHIAIGSKAWSTNVTFARKCVLPLLTA